MKTPSIYLCRVHARSEARGGQGFDFLFVQTRTTQVVRFRAYSSVGRAPRSHHVYNTQLSPFFFFFSSSLYGSCLIEHEPPRSPYVAQRGAALTQKYLKSFPRRKEERRTTKDERRRKTDSTSAPRTSHLEGVGVRCFPVYCTPPIKTLNGTAATLKPKCGRRRRQTPPRI